MLKIFNILGIGLILMTGCSLNSNNNPAIITGEGPVVTKVIPLDSIENVVQAGSGNTIITHGATQKVTIKAQQNILDHITYNVDNYVFTWGFDQAMDIGPGSDSVNIEIELTRNIKSINLTGSGNVIAGGPRQRTLKIAINGAGNVLCYNVATDNCIVNLYGQGICQVNVSDTLSGFLSGHGYIYYKGNPVIEVPVLGTGSVLSAN